MPCTDRLAARAAELLALTASLVLLAPHVLAYSPGSGTLYTDDFEAGVDEGWVQSNGFGGTPSPWERRLDGADWAFHADGQAQFPGAATLHRAEHALHPTTVATVSIALELRSEREAGQVFDLEIEQRAESDRRVRLAVDTDGAVAIRRSTPTGFETIAATAPNAVPGNATRWLKLAFADDSAGLRIRARVWAGGAAAEPATWDLDVVDDLRTLERVHRLVLLADGPVGAETWVDDLDVWGDPGEGVASTVTEIWIAELSHLDIGFTEPPDEVALFGKTHLDQVLDNLDADADYRWTIESGWWLEQWWDRSDDAERQRMVDALRGDRLTLAAGYANLTSTMVGHEELIRNVYWSSRMARRHGFPLRVFVQDDVPGSTFATPEVLARSGIDYYVGGMNCGFGGALTAPDHGDRPFWWVGPDGSRVLSWVTYDSYAEAFQYGFSFFDNLETMYDKLGAKLPEQEEAGYPYPELLLLRGFDNHYQGFHARNLVNQWNATYDTPRFRLASVEEFLDHMRASYGDETFPEFSGDFGAAWARSRAHTPHSRAWSREAHRDARAGEALHAAATVLDGDPYPTALADRAYLKMLEWDEHTGAGGWPGYFTPEEMTRNNEQHLDIARDARDAAAELGSTGLARLVGTLPVEGDAVVVVNALGRARTGLARAEIPEAVWPGPFRVVDRATGVEVVAQRDEPTRTLRFVADAVPSWGYRVFDLVPGSPTAVPQGQLDVTADTLENDHYRLVVDPADGSIASLLEKATGRELVDAASPYGFNTLASNTKQQYDAGQAPVAEPPSGATLAVLESGPVVASIEVTRSGSPHVRTVYRMVRGDDRVEIVNRIDRSLTPYVPQSTGTRAYTVTWPFDVHDFDIRTETTTRFLDPVGDSFGRVNVFDYHNAEHSIWIGDGAGGVATATDAVSAVHLENLTSLASATYSTGDGLMLPRLYDRADEYEFDGGTVGAFEFEPGTSSLLDSTHHLRGTPATFDPDAVSRFGFESLSPLLGTYRGRSPGDMPDDAAAIVRVDGVQGAEALLPYTFKAHELGRGSTVRVTNLDGAATTARVASDVLAFSNPERIEADEDGGTPLALVDGEIEVPIGPYETATVRFDATPSWAPLALHADRVGNVVRVSWSGGVAPFTLERSEDPSFATFTVVADETTDTSVDDPVVDDGRTWFYRVR